jgi:hypothetical protein
MGFGAGLEASCPYLEWNPGSPARSPSIPTELSRLHYSYIKTVSTMNIGILRGLNSLHERRKYVINTREI